MWKPPVGWQKSHILVINNLRVLGSGPHTSPQLFWEYPPGAFPAVTDELQAFKRKETASQFKQNNLTMSTAGSFSERSSITINAIIRQSTFPTDHEFSQDVLGLKPNATSIFYLSK